MRGREGGEYRGVGCCPWGLFTFAPDFPSDFVQLQVVYGGLVVFIGEIGGLFREE